MPLARLGCPRDVAAGARRTNNLRSFSLATLPLALPGYWNGLKPERRAGTGRLQADVREVPNEKNWIDSGRNLPAYRDPESSVCDIPVIFVLCLVA